MHRPVEARRAGDPRDPVAPRDPGSLRDPAEPVVLGDLDDSGDPRGLGEPGDLGDLDDSGDPRDLGEPGDLGDPRHPRDPAVPGNAATPATPATSGDPATSGEVDAGAGAAVERAYREHWARLLAMLTSELRDLDLAEEALQEAYTAAVTAWPPVPANPPAWLLTTARRRAVDRLRRTAVAARKLPLLIVDEPDHHEVPDDRLRLIFTCCHPALSMEARVALTLRCVGGLTTRQIARLFLVSEATMAARLTRAKKKISQAGIPYRVPDGEELTRRRDGVLAVIYLIFTEGYAATEGERVISHELAGEAIALASLLVGLLPGDSEARALQALMMLHHARRDARVQPDGTLVTLADQDRSRWHHHEIAAALEVLRPGPPGPYLIQAAIAVQHATAATAEETDWREICELYGLLETLTGSAVVRLNRAVAVAEAHGAARGLDLLDGLDLPGYHLLPATRAELLRRLGRTEEALAEYGRAIALVGTAQEREFLITRRRSLDEESTP
ncbi:sigma-70 family RNA polymerase sigma factor [Nonomuraea sp. NPDC050328]|uniref:sigma-70 family RNA polymerase sigma factor n=1 Tax=Nonomuraea sp. NPDC050328 TaxID=3364361 RepID=UPI00378856FC